MKISYDPMGEVLYIEFNDNRPFNTDFESVPGLALEYDEQGKICAIEIEDAAQLVKEPHRIQFEVLLTPKAEDEKTQGLEPEVALEVEHAQSD